MKKIYILLPFLILMTVVLFGCGQLEDAGETTYSLTIWPTSATLSIGESRHFYAVMGTADGTVSIVDAAFSITGSVGSISSSGLFTAEAVGTGTVIAAYLESTATVSVEVK